MEGGEKRRDNVELSCQQTKCERAIQLTARSHCSKRSIAALCRLPTASPGSDDHAYASKAGEGE